MLVLVVEDTIEGVDGDATGVITGAAGLAARELLSGFEC